MKIAQIAPLQVAVPPRNYGGTERVVANLVEALVQLGHDVTLFATGDSKTSAELVPYVPEAFSFDPEIDANAYHLGMLAQVYRQAERFDVIHSHLDYLTLPFTRWTNTPTVLTLHGRLDMANQQHVFRAFPEVNYVSISKNQQSFIPELNWVGTVHHSVDVDTFPFSSRPGEYLAFVGRISPEKGPEHAIAIAKKAGIPLKIAAKVDPKDREYHERVVAPLLDDPLIEFLGPVDEEHKRELMVNSLALLLPIQWDEPFGMVFIEALACGIPILTCPRGSVPELLRNGVTGYAYADDDELAEAASRVHTISREGCRAYAKRRFDIHRLALEYVNVFGRVRRRRGFFSLPAIEEDVAPELPAPRKKVRGKVADRVVDHVAGGAGRPATNAETSAATERRVDRVTRIAPAAARDKAAARTSATAGATGARRASPAASGLTTRRSIPDTLSGGIASADEQTPRARA